jgi:hydrogenase maturation protease
MKRIICIGNAFQDGDSAGAQVLAWLANARLPEGLEVVDGGIMGLDLLRLVETSERVAFVDAVSGFALPGAVITLEGKSLDEIATEGYGHSGGFSYLLRALPYLLKPPIPVCLIGLEPPFPECAIEQAGRLALAFATLIPDCSLGNLDCVGG